MVSTNNNNSAGGFIKVKVLVFFFVCAIPIIGIFRNFAMLQQHEIIKDDPQQQNQIPVQELVPLGTTTVSADVAELTRSTTSRKTHSVNTAAPASTLIIPSAATPSPTAQPTPVNPATGSPIAASNISQIPTTEQATHSSLTTTARPKLRPTTGTLAPVVHLPNSTSLSLPALGPEQTAYKSTETDYDYDFIKFKDTRTRFPVPPWLDAFLNTQPTGSGGDGNAYSQQHLERLNDPKTKFIVVICYKYAHKGTLHDEDCGGLTDRLALLPYQLWWAHKTGRMLLIKYFKPRPLEEFLVPPPHGAGFDWRLPDGYLEDELRDYANNRTKDKYKMDRWWLNHNLVDQEPLKSQRVIFMNHNLAHTKLTKIMDAIVGSSVIDLWPGLFRRMFIPSRAVANAIMAVVNNTHPNNLAAGEYAAAHLRAKWPGTELGRLHYTNGRKWFDADKKGGKIDMNHTLTFKTVATIANHAVECAVRIMPETEYVYVASDAGEVVEYLQEQSPYWANHHATDSPPRTWGGSTAANYNSSKPELHGWGVPAWTIATTKATIISRPDYHSESMHFDAMVWASPEGGIPVFVDLWLMAHAKCHSTGVGGFGRFASVLSGNRRNCASFHRDLEQPVPSCATAEERNAWHQEHN